MLAPVHESKKLHLWREFLAYVDGPFQEHIKNNEVDYDRYNSTVSCRRCLGGWYMFDVHHADDTCGWDIKRALMVNQDDSYEDYLMRRIIGSNDYGDIAPRRKNIVEFIRKLEQEETIQVA